MMSSIGVNTVVFVIHGTSKEIKEGFLSGFAVEDSFCSLLSRLLRLLLLVNLVISIKEAESEDDESNEEVYYLECDFSLVFNILPLSWNQS